MFWDVNLGVEVLTVIIEVIVILGMVICALLFYSYYRNGIRLNLILLINFIFLLGGSSTNYGRIFYDWDHNLPLNILFYYIIFIGNYIASIFGYYIFLKIKNLDKHSILYSKRDKICFLTAIIGMLIIISFNFLGTEIEYISLNIIFVKGQIPVKLMIGFSLFSIVIFIMIESKTFKTSLSKFEKPLNKHVNWMILASEFCIE